MVAQALLPHLVEWRLDHGIKITDPGEASLVPTKVVAKRAVPQYPLRNSAGPFAPHQRLEDDRLRVARPDDIRTRARRCSANTVYGDSALGKMRGKGRL